MSVYPNAAICIILVPLSSQHILDILINAKALAPSPHVSLESLADDISRKWNVRRQKYRVWQGDACVIQLYVAADLKELYSRANGFHESCASITSKPIFFIQADGHDFVGFEFVEGIDAEKSYLEGSLSSDELLQAITKLDSVLDASQEKSSIQAAAAELDVLFHSLHEIKLFSDIDRAILDNFIVPGLRASLLVPDPKTRWTNGDFLTQNIVVTGEGPRLLDYEFAARTHFYCEDWARLCRNSIALPACIRDWAQVRLGPEREAAEIYGLLRQIVLEAGIKAPPDLTRAVEGISRELSPLIERWRSRATRSVFLPVVSGPGKTDIAEAKLQVFYSTDIAFRETSSIYAAIAEGVWSRVEVPLPIGHGHWNIRLDPIDCAGIVEITSLDINLTGGIQPVGQTTPLASKPISLAGLIPQGTCVVTSIAPALTVIGFGPDPQLVFSLDIEEPGPVWIAAWIRWERLETGLGRVLTAQATRDASAATKLVLTSENLLVAVNDLRARLEASRQGEDLAARNLSAISLLLEQQRSACAEAELAHDAQHAASAQAKLERDAKLAALSSALENQRAASAEAELAHAAQLAALSGTLENQRAASAEAELVYKAQLAALSSTLENQRAAFADAELVFKTERTEFKNSESLVQERQRGFDRGAVQFVAKCRDLETALYLVRQGLSERERQRDKLQLERDILIQENSGIKHGLASAQQRVSELETSLSWKITSPGRTILDRLQKRSKHNKNPHGDRT